MGYENIENYRNVQIIKKAVCTIKSLRRRTDDRLIFGKPYRLHSAFTKASSEMLEPSVSSPLVCAKERATCLPTAFPLRSVEIFGRKQMFHATR